MEWNIWLTLLFAAIIISLSPGAGALTAMSYGLSHGLQRGFAAVLGLQLGFGLQIVIVGVGLGSIIATSSLMFTIIKWIGVLYLIYLGIMKWREKVHVDLHQVDNTVKFSSRKAFIEAIFINLTNPKSLVFLVALLPQFIDPQQPQFIQLLIIGVTLLGVDTVVMSGYSLMASKLRVLLHNPQTMRLQNRITGSVLIGAGVLLSTATRH